MAARSLGLAAAFGLAANAFLLPPSVSSDDIHTDSDLATWTLINPDSQPLLVPCKGCEVDGPGAENLFLNISVGSQPGTLELSGKPFYPPTAFITSAPETMPSALAVPTGKSLADVMAQPDKYTSVPISGWKFSAHKVQTVSEDGEELLELTLNINSVNRDAVSIPSIELRVMKDTEARMNILSTSWSDDEQVPETPEIGQPNEEVCESALCQWRQFIQNKVHGMAAASHKFGSGRPCPGRMMKDGRPHGPFGSHGPFTNMHHGPNSHHHRPIGETGRPHHRHHHGHMRHHKFHHFMHRLGRFVMTVAIPILIGIAAGVVTYAVGMVIGCAIALIWIKVFRGGKRGYASVALTEDDAAVKELEVEGDSRESFESAPPVYEDAPAYEEKEAV